MGDFPPEELPIIIDQRFRAAACPTASEVTEAEAHALAQLYSSLNSQQAGIHITMRELIKIVRRKAALRCTLLDATLSLLSTKAAPGSDASQQLLKGIQAVQGWDHAAWPEPGSAAVQQLEDGVEFSLGRVRLHLPGAQLAHSLFWVAPAAGLELDPPPPAFLTALVQVAFAVATGELI